MRVFTIGYSGFKLLELLELLRDVAVTDVFDVRYNPFSFIRGFSRKHLRAALEENGVRYRHVPELGTPPDLRKRGKELGSFGAIRDDMARLLGERSAAVDDLVESADGDRICLLCLEADHESCHRSLVAGMIAERTGAEVVHLGACEAG